MFVSVLVQCSGFHWLYTPKPSKETKMNIKNHWLSIGFRIDLFQHPNNIWCESLLGCGHIRLWSIWVSGLSGWAIFILGPFWFVITVNFNSDLTREVSTLESGVLLLSLSSYFFLWSPHVLYVNFLFGMFELWFVQFSLWVIQVSNFSGFSLGFLIFPKRNHVHLH